MSHIFRHKENKNLYIIEHLIHDIRFTNRNAFRGIYAYPYKWDGETITHIYEDELENFKPKEFVKNNFEIVTYLN